MGRHREKVICLPGGGNDAKLYSKEFAAKEFSRCIRPTDEARFRCGFPYILALATPLDSCWRTQLMCN
jgi:hypothetical protein